MEFKKVINKFKNIFFIFALLIVAQGKVNSEENKIHKLCLDARDYQGCINSNKGFKSPESNQKILTSEKEECYGNAPIICTAKKGYDFLGTPKIVGWKYIERPRDSSIDYFQKVPYKVKAKGKYGRYIDRSVITRTYYGPTAGTSSSIIGGGTTNCYDTGYGTFSCNSSSPTIISGKPSTPGGIYQSRFRTVIDCEDKKYRDYDTYNIPSIGRTVRKKSKWISLSSEKASSSDKNIAKEYCSNIDSLITSDFNKFK